MTSNRDHNSDNSLQRLLKSALIPDPPTDEQIDRLFAEHLAEDSASGDEYRFERILTRTLTATQSDSQHDSMRKTSVVVRRLDDRSHGRIGANDRGSRSNRRGAVAAMVVSAMSLLMAFFVTSDGARRSEERRAFSRAQEQAQLQSFRQGWSLARSAAVPEAEHIRVGDAVQTVAQERRRVTLPDGSILYVNESTSVTVASERRVVVDRGEVFVEVQSRKNSDDGREKFEIVTPSRTVTALGTKFGVSTEGQDADVLVTQGKVRVSGVKDVVESGQILKEQTDSKTPRKTASSGLPTKNARGAKILTSRRASEHLAWTRDLMTAASASIVPPSRHSGGSVISIDPSGQEMKMSLRRYHVDVHIEDGFARTTIDQTYFNHTQQRLEGTFRFPLPPDASLSRLAMYVNGKLMEGGMAEREHARNTFEKIVHRMKDPALLEWVDGSTFKVRVFPLEPRQEKRIVLSYSQRLKSAYGKTVYRFPAGHNMDVVDRWSTQIRVHDGVGADWHSPSHKLTATSEGSSLLLSAKAANSRLDKDIVLELKPASREEGGNESRWSHCEFENDQYLMLRFRPDLPGQTTRQPRHWTFIVEVSADRTPELARTQIEILRTLLEHAEHSDTFQVITANTNAQVLSKKLLDCSADNIAKAILHLEQTHLIGALNLEDALRTAARDSGSNNDPALERVVVHLGSAVPVLGEQSADELLKLLPPETAYVGVGVGNSWSRSFAKSAAAKTGGFFTQINPDEEVAWRAFELSSTLNSPRLLNISVQSQSDDSAANWLNVADTITQGEEICSLLRVRRGEALPKKVTVKGLLDGRPWSRTLKVRKVNRPAEYLPRTWARLEIDRLVSIGAAAHKDDIVALSKSMYVMSPFTSLLVLENEEMYTQHGIDRGRKDHWALYDCPNEIPVVREPITDRGVDVAEAKSNDGLLETIRFLPPVTSEPAMNYWGFQARSGPRNSSNQGLISGFSSLHGEPNLFFIDRDFDQSAAPAQLYSYRAPVALDDFANGVRPLMSVTNSVATEFARPGRFIHSVDELAAEQFDFIQNARADDVTVGFRLPGLGVSDANELHRPGIQPPAFSTQTDDDTSDFLVPRFGRPSLAYPYYSHRGTQEYGVDGEVPEMNLAGIVPSQLSTLSYQDFGSVQSSDRIAGVHDLIQKRPPENVWLDVASPDVSLHLWTPPQQSRPNVISYFDANLQLPELRHHWMESTSSNVSGPQSLSRQMSPSLLGVDTGLAGNDHYFSLSLREQILQSKATQLGWATLPLNWQDGNWRLRFPGAESQNAGAVSAGWRNGFGDYTVSGLADSRLSLQNSSPGGSRVRVADLLAHAPALNTSEADVLALAEKRTRVPVARGVVDDGASDLIHTARSLGWERIGLPAADGSEQLTVMCDGFGKHVYERIVSEGLRERVICDGRRIWHRYSEIGLASERHFSRFHRRTIQALVPWLLPSVDDLSVGANVRLVDDRTVAIVPLSQNDDAKSGRSEAQVEMRLLFESDGRLTERRWVRKSDSDEKILQRMRFESSGMVRVFDENGEERIAVQFARSKMETPDLRLDERELVIVPMPIRSVEFVENQESKDVDGESDASKTTGKMQRLLALIAENRGQEAAKLVARHFYRHGHDEDRLRDGFHVLLSRFPSSLVWEDDVPESEGRKSSIDLRPSPDGSALRQFLRQSILFQQGPERDVVYEIEGPDDGFVQRLATAINIHQRWQTGRATEGRSRSQIRKELQRSLEFVSKCRLDSTGWWIVSAIRQSIHEAEFQEMLANALKSYESNPRLALAARIQRVRLLYLAQKSGKARTLHAEMMVARAQAGLVPRVDRDLYQHFVSTPEGPEKWHTVVKRCADALLRAEKLRQTIDFSQQLYLVEDHDAVHRLLERVLKRFDRSTAPDVVLSAIRNLNRLKDGRASELVDSLSQNQTFRNDPKFWRYASTVADDCSHPQKALRHLERAIQLEFENRPDVINVKAVRQTYSRLMDRYRQVIEASEILETEVPADLYARIIRAADQWRSMEDDPTDCCQVAAELLRKLRRQDEAWQYLTTPLADRSGESSPWQRLAKELTATSQFELADMAWTRAFRFEKTNPEILLEHSKMLAAANRSSEADRLLRRILDSAWQPRYSKTRQQAETLLNH